MEYHPVLLVYIPIIIGISWFMCSDRYVFPWFQFWGWVLGLSLLFIALVRMLQAYT